MPTDLETRTGSRTTTWRRVTLALLGGTLVESVLVFLAAGNQYSIRPPPVRAAPVFVWIATVTLPAFLLLYWDEVVGDAAAVLAGSLTEVGVGLIGSGSFGPLSAEAIRAARTRVVLSTAVAWRTRSAHRAMDLTKAAAQ